MPRQPISPRILHFSAAARAHLDKSMKLLAKQKGCTLALIQVGGCTTSETDGTVSFSFSGTHYALVGYEEAILPARSFVQIGTYAVSIEAHVFRALRGKVIDLVTIVDCDHGGEQALLLAR